MRLALCRLLLVRVKREEGIKQLREVERDGGAFTVDCQCYTDYRASARADARPVLLADQRAAK
jgi:hypothetical protein